MLSHIRGNSVNDLQFISDDGYRLVSASDDTTVAESLCPACRNPNKVIQRAIRYVDSQRRCCPWAAPALLWRLPRAGALATNVPSGRLTGRGDCFQTRSWVQGSSGWEAGWLSRYGRLSDEEGRRLQQIVRRGKHGSVRVRRAMIIMASASGTLVPAIARLVAADEDTVRDVIHLFNAKGLAALDPQWAGGRPRLISDEAIDVIVAAARTRPEKLGLPFTRWSLRKLAAYLASRRRPVRIGRERLRQILHARGISFQRTRTWKESADPDRDAKLDRIEYVTSHYPDRCFAFDQFGPLSVRPCPRACWAPRKRPARLRATYRHPLLPRLLRHRG